MKPVFSILSMLLSLGGMVCGIIILIEAFKSAVWKGILCLVTCGLYMLYFAFAEFTHDKKWMIIGGWLGAGILSGILRVLSQ
jgi:hypothetical protein